MSAPRVQTIAEAMADLNPAYQESRDVINQRQAGLGAKYDAQRAGLHAERGESFNAINDQATGRGMSFSGIPMHEQARYLSTKYLPGLQMADFQQNEEGLTLKGQLADINKEQRLGATSRVDQQQSALNQWNMQQAQLEAQRREAELQRQFQAQQAAADRAFQAQQNAANRASQRAASASSGPSVYAQTQAMLLGAAQNGKVDRGTWEAAAAFAKANGMSFGGEHGFASSFWNFAKHGNYKSGMEKYM